MIYTLMIWTLVAMGGSAGYKSNDWRPIGEFHSSPTSNGLELCEAAARQLGWTSDQHQKYRCVRSK